ncbi:MAG TPA: glycosyltransferase family 2 protein [Actinomycetota bacterium]|nr:glycosyltransferase family 2 protein [Actinomycetota bacterium]
MTRDRDVVEPDSAGAVGVFVVGGAGGEALRETVVATGALHVWCAVPSITEAAAVTGLADSFVLDPWPGPAAALDYLARSTQGKRSGMAIILLRAGTILRRGTVRRATSRLRDHEGLVVPTRRGDRGTAIRLRMFRRAPLDPGSGVIVSAVLLFWLVRAGWLTGTPLTIGLLRRAGARLHSLRRGLASPSKAPRQDRPTITVLIPARNESAYLGETLRSLEAQSIVPDEVIVVDDASDDGTGDIARAHGARVIRPGSAQGSKAIASNAGLADVRTEAVMILDADTQLHPECLEHLSDDLRRGLDATSGACLPLLQQGIWARGRAIEYSMAIRIFKPVQRALGTLVVMSGCNSMFRTSLVRGLGGFSDRTLAEDLDLTWAHQLQGGKAGYNGRAMSYPVEPATWTLYRAQIRRWASGFYQTIGVHRMRLRHKPGLALIVAAAVFDVITVPIFLTMLTIATIKGSFSWPFLAMSSAFLLLPIISGITVIGWRKTAKNFPAYLITIWASSYFYLEALIIEWIARRHRVAWVKGH